MGQLLNLTKFKDPETHEEHGYKGFIFIMADPKEYPDFNEYLLNDYPKIENLFGEEYLVTFYVEFSEAFIDANFESLEKFVSKEFPDIEINHPESLNSWVIEKFNNIVISYSDLAKRYQAEFDFDFKSPKLLFVENLLKSSSKTLEVKLADFLKSSSRADQEFFNSIEHFADTVHFTNKTLKPINDTFDLETTFDKILQRSLNHLNEEKEIFRREGNQLRQYFKERLSKWLKQTQAPFNQVDDLHIIQQNGLVSFYLGEKELDFRDAFSKTLYLFLLKNQDKEFTSSQMAEDQNYVREITNIHRQVSASAKPGSYFINRSIKVRKKLLSEAISKINANFQKIMTPSVVEEYRIQGERNEYKSVKFPFEHVSFESEEFKERIFRRRSVV